MSADPQNAPSVRFGFYRSKDKTGYIAVDRGKTFVDTIAYSVRDEEQAMALCDLANEALDHRSMSLWQRLRWAIRPTMRSTDAF